MPIDFVVPGEDVPAKEKPITIVDAREALYKAQRDPDRAAREATKAAAAAEERAQVAMQKRSDAQQEDALPVYVPTPTRLHDGNPRTIEELHARIRKIRAENEAKLNEVAVPPTPPPRIAERTAREMAAGARANERSLKQRELELKAGAATAQGLPMTPSEPDTTVHTPVYRPDGPTPNVDQNKPFTLTRGA